MEVLDVSKFTYSEHAIGRFMERTDCDDENQAVRHMTSIIKMARKAYRKNFAYMFFKYGQQPTDYYITSQWVFVSVKNEIVTCYKKTRKEIKQMYRPVEES
jgi:hypothetical protein